MKQVWIDEEQGLHALFRESNQVSERLRRPILEQVDPNDVDDEGNQRPPAMSTMNRMFDHLIVALVAEWNLPVPFSMDALLDLPAAQYDALRNAAMPHMNELVPDFGVSPAADSPTEPSDA